MAIFGYTAVMKINTRQKRKPGPVSGAPSIRTTVVLETELADWGKNQPGGLSNLLRQLLREAKKKEPAK